MEYKVTVNYKDTGRDSDDPVKALVEFAEELLKPFGVTVKGQYDGLGDVVFDISRTTMTFEEVVEAYCTEGEKRFGTAWNTANSGNWQDSDNREVCSKVYERALRFTTIERDGKLFHSEVPL